VSWSLFNQVTCGLRFFFAVTLGRPDVVSKLPYGKKPKPLPLVLAPAEVLQLFDGASCGRDRALLQTTYACGLRVSEVVGLRPAARRGGGVPPRRLRRRPPRRPRPPGQGPQGPARAPVGAPARRAPRLLAAAPAGGLAVPRRAARTAAKRGRRPEGLPAGG